MKTKLKNIFYLNKASKKYINYGLDYNKKIIGNIYKYNAQKITISILEKTFFENFSHFKGNIYLEELDGLEKEYINTINEFKNKEESDDYIHIFKYLVNRFEKKIILKKKYKKNIEKEKNINIRIFSLC